MAGRFGRALLATFGEHEPMTSNGPDARARFEAKVLNLVGRRVLAVDYWDIHNFSSETARWDYGDWHHAVMGVQLSTDAGAITVTWTSVTRRARRIPAEKVPRCDSARRRTGSRTPMARLCPFVLRR